MSRYIDADELWEKAKVRVEDNGGLSLPNLYWIIKDLPTAEAEPIRHGRWVKIESDDWANATEYRCSECGKYRLAVNPVDYNWNYCPNCGARMDLPESMTYPQVEGITPTVVKMDEVTEVHGR